MIKEEKIRTFAGRLLIISSILLSIFLFIDFIIDTIAAVSIGAHFLDWFADVLAQFIYNLLNCFVWYVLGTICRDYDNDKFEAKKKITQNEIQQKIIQENTNIISKKINEIIREINVIQGEK